MIHKCLKNRQRICHVEGLSKQDIELSVLKKKASNSEYLEIKQDPSKKPTLLIRGNINMNSIFS